MIARLFRSESGVTLVELSIAMIVAAVIASAMVAWLVQIANQDTFVREADDALAAMATAKARMVKELRFASSVDTGASDAHNVVFWVDEDQDTVQDAGETVTWTIEADGDLIRTTDLPSTELHVSGLVYDVAAAPGTSQFSYSVAGDSVTIELTADVDSADGPLPKKIKTEVHLRNA